MRTRIAIACLLVACAGDKDDSVATVITDNPSGDAADGGDGGRVDAAPPDQVVGSRDAGADAQAAGDALPPEVDASTDAAPNASPDAGSDAGPDCAPTCPATDLRCDADVVQRCEADDDGCTRWNDLVDCSLTADVCMQDATTAHCEAPAETCNDDLLNQDESDTDCGGTTCGGCPEGGACMFARDCAMGTCISGACTTQIPTCTDRFALPGGFASPNSLPWPLLAQDTGEPRHAIGSSFGEYQSYGEGIYVHTGIDVRGLEGDYVKVVADGNIWLTANLAQCDDFAGTSCRLYIQDLDGRYIYYYSHLRLSAYDPMSVVLRDKILNATPKGSGYDIQPDTDVYAGDTLSAIADFAGDQWAHVHFGMFDADENYDGINPLLALDPETATPPMIDDEPPWITSVALREDGMTTELVPSDACEEITGAVDVVAVMGDAFYTNDPAPAAVPGPINSIGVYEARLLVRNVATGQTTEWPWYRFDRAPFVCAGPDRGTACPTPMSETDFFAGSIDRASGAAWVATTYASVLFEAASSSSNYLGTEIYTHVLTHSWGLPGAWDTTVGTDGLYQLSVEARDHAGNRTARSRFVVVDNDGMLDPSTLPPDAYIRDHDDDTGAVPSTLGDAPFWRSPDILVYPTGTSVDVDSAATTTPLVEGESYDVYVRVHNDRCAPALGIRVRLTSLPPSLSGDRSDAVAITSDFATDASHATGLDLDAAESALLGPFAWTPTAAELAAYDGHRVVLAEIDAATDPLAATSGVQDDNNAAMRSVQRLAGPSTASFVLDRTGPGAACAQLVIQSNGLPMTDPATRIEVHLPYHPDLAGAWNDVPGAVITHDMAADDTMIVLERARVALPPLLLVPGLALSGTATLQKPAGAAPEAGARLSLYIDGRLASGVDLQ